MGTKVLEDLFIGERVVVVGTEVHPKYRELNVHYSGTLIESSSEGILLIDWNDTLIHYATSSRYGKPIGLYTIPTDRSKDVFIPKEKVKHIHTLDEGKLRDEESGEKKSIFHITILK